MSTRREGKVPEGQPRQRLFVFLAIGRNPSVAGEHAEKIETASGLPTAYLESSHPVRNAAQSIIARTIGAHSWHQTRPVRNPVTLGSGGVGEVYRATDTLLRSGFGLPTKLHCSDEHRLEG
jgi:hypothetical protein